MHRTQLAGASAIPVAASSWLVAGVVAANLFCGTLLPLYLLPLSSWWLLALLPLVALTIPHWALIHEAVHGHLHPSRSVNDALARLLSILFGAAFLLLRFGHLSHYVLNGRAEEHPELYDPKAISWLRASAAFYFRLFFGLNFAEFLGNVLCLLPRSVLRPVLRRVFYDNVEEAWGMADRAERQLLHPRALARSCLEHPNLPWTALSQAFAVEGRRYAGSYFTVPLRQLRGPIPLLPQPIPLGSEAGSTV